MDRMMNGWIYGCIYGLIDEYVKEWLDVGMGKNIDIYFPSEKMSCFHWLKHDT